MSATSFTVTLSAGAAAIAATLGAGAGGWTAGAASGAVVPVPDPLGSGALAEPVPVPAVRPLTRLKPISATTAKIAATMAAVQFGRRRSLTLIGPVSSNWVGRFVAGAPPCAASYRATRVSPSMPTALAIERMWPRA